MGFFSGSNNDKQYAEKAAGDKAGNFNSNPFYSVVDPATLNDITKKASDKVASIFNKDVIGDTLDQFKYFDKWSLGNNIPGLKAYPIPSVEKYDRCIENNGASVWDENGWWRCLFPNSVARKGEVSLEDVQDDQGNKYGLFFKDYNEFLGWRSQVRKLVKEQELIKQRENIQSIYNDYARDNDADFNDDNSVVRTSKSVYFRTLPNGDSEEITKIKNVYKDGRKENESIRKLFPKDGGEPIVTNMADENKSKGWIWNKDN